MPSDPVLASAALAKNDRDAAEWRRLLLVIGGLLLIILVPYYITTLDRGWPIARDGSGLAVGRDFLNFWMAGRAALAPDPARIYDLHSYWQLIEAVAGPHYPGQQLSYPPTIMVLAAPFGLLPYGPALILWSVGSVMVFAAAVRLWTPDRVLISACVLLPAGIFGLVSGQFSYLGAAAILAILRWRETRPVLAGILLGLLTLKPQLGILFPVLLLATRNWRVIAVASLVAVTLSVLAGVMWGIEVWQQYVRVGVHNQSGVLSDPKLLAAPFMPTIFMNLRIAGLSVAAAYGVQTVFALFAAGLVAMAFARGPTRDDANANALFAAASVIATPYLMAYDLLALSVLAVLLVAQDAKPRVLTLLVVMLPLLQMAMGAAGLPGAALVLVLFALALSGSGSGLRRKPFYARLR